MSYRRNVLIDEQYLALLPTLATRIGVNEAIIVQRIHFWLGVNVKNGRHHAGRKWIYNTYPEWHDQFPFWSESTIKRTMWSLEKQGIIESTDSLNRMNSDRTKWYTINYDHECFRPIDQDDQPSGQNDPSVGSEWSPPTNTVLPVQSEDSNESSYAQPAAAEQAGGYDASPADDGPKKQRARHKYSEDFEGFWKSYPKGHGVKKVAYAEWQKLDEPERLAAVDGLNVWRRSKRWADGYIRDAERYLKYRMWENPPADLVAPSNPRQPQQTEADPYWGQMLAGLEGEE